MSAPASITSGVNYSLKPTSVRCKRTTININASNKTTFQAGDVATFFMPSHANSVIDGSSCYLSFRVKATTTGYVQGSAHSFIDRLYTVSAGGNPISDLQNYRSIANTMLDLQLSHSERVGLSPMLGTEEECFTASGISSSFATGSKPTADEVEQMVPKVIRRGKKLSDGVTYTFCIPLLHPIFGSLAEKFFPCYKLSDVTRLEFTWSTVRNALVTCTDYEISNPTIYCDYLEFDQSVFPMIEATSQDVI